MTIAGTVQLTGPTAPTFSTDVFGTHFADYGIGGMRSVVDHAARDAYGTTYPTRCQQGMLIVTQNDNLCWQLNTATPAGTSADWTAFGVGGVGSSAYSKGAYWGNQTYPLSIATLTDTISSPCQSAGAIKSVDVVAIGTSGNVTIDVWKCSGFAGYPPVLAGSVCGGNYPAISAGTKFQDTTLTSWSTAVSQGDYFLFHVRSVSSGPFTYLEINLRIA